MKALLAAALFLLAPVPVAACLCAVIVTGGDRAAAIPPPPSFSEMVKGRDAVFVGTVLWTENPSGMMSAVPDPQRPQRVLFQVHRSWKEVRQDTVTLLVGPEPPCVRHDSGRRYLVVADGNSGALRTARCDEAIPIDREHATDVIDDLGEPIWMEPNVGGRSIDADLIPLGAPPPPGREVRLHLMFERSDGPPPPDRVEIADLRVPGPGTGGMFSMRLTEAVYRLRLEWASGQAVEGDIWVRCEPVGSLGACVSRRVMWDLVDEAHVGVDIRQDGNDT